MEVSTILKRKTFTVVDEIGMDPLRDKSYEAIQSISQYTIHNVVEGEEFNLPAIASMHYGFGQWWWVILIYNGIADEFSVKRGTKLRIPDANALNSVLAKAHPINEQKYIEY